MTERMAADDLCEHHYETRILGGQPITVGACIFCRTPDWADLREQAAELYRWGWQEGRDGKAARETLSAYDKPRPSLTPGPFSYEERQRTGRNAGLCTHPDGYDGECPCPPGCVCCPVAAATPQTALQRIQRLRGQLAAEHAKAVAADQHPRPDLDHLRVTPHNGMAVGLEIALFFADHHLREAGEEARTTPDNPATSNDMADNPLRADAEAWRHKAVRRALAISKLRGTIDACTDLADEPVTDRTGWGDGYRTAISDLRAVLQEFGYIELGERP